MQKCKKLEKLDDEIRECSKCSLNETRRKAVPGEGRCDAEVLLVGEAPGREEDKAGRPFVGRAGEILTDLLREANLRRGKIFIGNVLKCRPPNNRDPRRKEIEKCSPYLKRQIDIIRPEIIVALGRFPAGLLSDLPVKISQKHGSLFPYRFTNHDIDLFLSYHPASVLYGTDKEILLEDFRKLKNSYL